MRTDRRYHAAGAAASLPDRGSAARYTGPHAFVRLLAVNAPEASAATLVRLHELVARQRAAFERERHPPLDVRRDRLRRLLALVREHEDAIAAYEAYLARNPGGSYTGEAQSALTKLKGP